MGTNTCACEDSDEMNCACTGPNSHYGPNRAKGGPNANANNGTDGAD